MHTHTQSSTSPPPPMGPGGRKACGGANSFTSWEVVNSMAVHTHIILHARIRCALNMGAVAYYNGHVISSFISWEVVASQPSATTSGLLLPPYVDLRRLKFWNRHSSTRNLKTTIGECLRFLINFKPMVWDLFYSSSCYIKRAPSNTVVPLALCMLYSLQWNPLTESKHPLVAALQHRGQWSLPPPNTQFCASCVNAELRGEGRAMSVTVRRMTAPRSAVFSSVL
jgi:hypothetical protein